jgi:signal transduction histidine kinase
VTESTGRGHRDGQPEDVELGSMMEQALARARIDARARGIAFHARYDPTLLLHVCPGPAIAALRNVVENAVRFSTHGDVAVDVEDRGAEVAVHIRDTSNGTAAGINLIVAPRAQESLGWAISAECSLNVRCHVCLTLPASHL